MIGVLGNPSGDKNVSSADAQPTTQSTAADADKEKETGKEIARLGGTRVLIVYGGGSIVRSGLLKTVEDSIGKSVTHVITRSARSHNEQ